MNYFVHLLRIYGLVEGGELFFQIVRNDKLYIPIAYERTEHEHLRGLLIAVITTHFHFCCTVREQSPEQQYKTTSAQKVHQDYATRLTKALLSLFKKQEWKRFQTDDSGKEPDFGCRILFLVPTFLGQ